MTSSIDGGPEVPAQASTGAVLAEAGDDGVWTITLSNESKRNAFNLRMLGQLADALETAERSTSCAVLVVRGAGSVAFCAGADIGELGTHRTAAVDRREYDLVSKRMLAGLRSISIPVIAAIDGFCIGGGMMLAMFADIRLASGASRFAIPAARLGVGYEPFAIRRLVELIGHDRVAEMMFTARTYDADEASRIGFVTHLFESGAEVHEAARSLARTIAANAPLTVRASKLAILDASVSFSATSPEAREAYDACFESEDYREGQAAFRERRAPSFRGR